jgi:hypothetical protein
MRSPPSQSVPDGPLGSEVCVRLGLEPVAQAAEQRDRLTEVVVGDPHAVEVHLVHGFAGTDDEGAPLDGIEGQPRIALLAGTSMARARARQGDGADAAASVDDREPRGADRPPRSQEQDEAVAEAGYALDRAMQPAAGNDAAGHGIDDVERRLEGATGTLGDGERRPGGGPRRRDDYPPGREPQVVGKQMHAFEIDEAQPGRPWLGSEDELGVVAGKAPGAEEEPTARDGPARERLERARIQLQESPPMPNGDRLPVTRARSRLALHPCRLAAGAPRRGEQRDGGKRYRHRDGGCGDQASGPHAYSTCALGVAVRGRAM